MLISLKVTKVIAQTQINDTVKKVVVDTLNTNNNDETLEETINYSAEDSVVFLASINKVMLYGKAKVVYVNMNLDAEFIEIDYTKNLVTAYGKKDSLGKNIGTPNFKDGEQTMNAEKIMYNLKTKKGKIFNAFTKQGELLVFGEQIKKDSSNVVYLKNMKCLPCQDEDARTAFRSNKAKIIPNDKIITGPMYLEIGGVPTPLGLPFGYFPNTKKQHNGILLPTFGNSPTQGYNLRNGGFYWGINDKTDMVINGDIFTNGTYAIRTANNYNVLYKASGAVNLEYNSINIGDRDIPNLYSQQKGYRVRWLHAQDNKNNPTIRFSANVDYSKNQNFNRLLTQNSAEFLQNSFNSNIVFSKTFKLSALSLNASHSQNYNSQSKQTFVTISFPQLTYNVNRFFPFKRESAAKQNVFDKIGVNYLFEARNTLTGFDSTIFKGDLEKRMAYGIKHTLPISTNFNLLKYITVTPAVNLNAVMYAKSIRQSFITDVPLNAGNIKTDTINGFVGGYDANFTTAFNTKVFFDYVFKKGKVKQIRHLLIPTISYVYRPDLGKEQYGFWKSVQTNTIGGINRYSIFQNNVFGGPAIGEQNAVNINLNNNIEAKIKKVSDTGVVYNKATLLQNLSASTGYNFAADSLKLQNITLSARTVLFKNFDVVASGNLNPYVYSQVTKQDIAKYQYNETGKLARLTALNLAVNTNISSDKIAAAKKLREAPNQSNGAEKGVKNDLDPNAKLPWNVALNYNLTLSNLNDTKLQPTHALNCRADVMPTKFWKVGVTTGYDFTRQNLSYTSVNIYRDLKCWEARIDWVPFGANKSYRVTVNIKASMLSEFKIPRSSPPINNL